ncbi:N-acetylglucosamine-6-phosphate deacetylase [Paenibacillus cellulosilyticus]|uniref:N-acetylglucosamine-6-phosphate deacetylase n=1 Tax=Paenibacillus cellulosilyticus TaxID=375489 RepID=A0A2V2YVQ9_9BACL|nr:N-acetylglucosamine-6-phosphate deacetylase [Paenibacillus cellulosilyticus]PWW05061.1 N-acetylglucosamine-6-phosphate deacetylase [Paenibacillus cellulosilyticus]
MSSSTSTSMSPLVLKNVKLVTPQGVLDEGWIRLADDRIEALGHGPIAASSGEGEIIDGAGGWVLPGFIDVHVHGGAGHDFMDADEEGLRAITKFHASHGTTGILATSLTASRDELTSVLDRVSQFMSTPMPYAQVLGVHFEGPFVSDQWKGAQNPDYILPPQPDWLEEWVSRYPGVIRIQTLAPEVDGALDYIERLDSHGIVPSCGHTDATYDQIIAAADRGLRHAVHTFNAMRPYHHREPGTVGAVLTDDRIIAEVIADGHHVHAAGIELLRRAKGPERVILVTDAMAAAGMPDGDYHLGELPVTMTCGVARLTNSGNLAGSTLTMIGALRHMVREIGVPIADASRMASGNPARQLGIDNVTGSIEVGKQADILLLSDQLEIERVWIGGQELELEY